MPSDKACATEYLPKLLQTRAPQTLATEGVKARAFARTDHVAPCQTPARRFMCKDGYWVGSALDFRTMLGRISRQRRLSMPFA